VVDNKSILLIVFCLISIIGFIGCVQIQPSVSPENLPAADTITQNTATSPPVIAEKLVVKDPPFTENTTALDQLEPPFSARMRQIAYIEPDTVYGVAGGIQLKMDIYYPKTHEAKIPVIIYIHGGQFKAGDKRDVTLDGMLSPLVESGYLVASINYRFVPQFLFPAQVEDAKCAVRFIRANAGKYGINAAKIGVIGGSAGGYLVNMVGVCNSSAGFDNSGGDPGVSSKVQGAVSMYGISELVSQRDSGKFEGPTGPVSQMIGNTDKFNEVAVTASPITYVSSDDSPFLLIHGDKDTDVLPLQSRILYEKLIAANVPSRLIIVKNGGHGFRPVNQPISPTIQEIIGAIKTFFGKCLR
jgi:acetyl esterase/lipase